MLTWVLLELLEGDLWVATDQTCRTDTWGRAVLTLIPEGGHGLGAFALDLMLGDRPPTNQNIEGPHGLYRVVPLIAIATVAINGGLL